MLKMLKSLSLNNYIVSQKLKQLLKRQFIDIWLKLNSIEVFFFGKVQFILN